MAMTLEEKRIRRARSRLLLKHQFFGTLASQLEIAPLATPDHFAGMAVDGTYLYYDPAKMADLDEPTLIGMTAHEVFHCALGHCYRMGTRPLERWNRACDYAINPMLKAAGLTLWPGHLDETRFHGMAAEQIDAILAREDREREKKNEPPPAQQPQPGLLPAPPPEPGEGKPKPGQQPSPTGAPQPGQGTDPATGQQPGQPQPAAPEKKEVKRKTATDWEIAAQTASMIAKGTGKMPGDAERAMRAAFTARTDWKAETREFVVQTIPSDVSWARPNRRFIADGIYLPGAIKENVGPLGIHVDTSGSIDQDDLDRGASNVTAIVHEVRPEKVIVVYCDASVQFVEEFGPDDEITFHPHGGGGTRFQPALDYFSELDEPPIAVISFTDLHNEDRGRLVEPDYPVLWCTDERSSRVAEFGRTLRLTSD